MIKREYRAVMVVYCDICGVEIKEKYRTFHFGKPEELHACYNWDPNYNATCSDRVASKLLLDALNDLKAKKNEHSTPDD